MKKRNVRKLVFLAIMAAVALVLRFFDFPLLLHASFLKFDLSDIVSFIGLLVDGIGGLVTVTVIRDLLNFIIKGGQSGIPIGAIMSSFASIALGLPLHFYLKKYGYNMEKKHLIKSQILSAISLTVVLSLLNYFIALPAYSKVMEFPIDDYANYVLTIIVPFNLLKGLLLGAVFYIIYPKLLKILEKKNLLCDTYLLD